MADRSAIEWTEATWNPVRGCTRVSPGCGGPGRAGGCYAEGMAARFSGPGQWGHGFAEMRGGQPRWTGKLALIESQLDLPLRWRKGRRIFVNSTSDLFHEALPDEAIDRVFAVMALAPQHSFQVLTKRAERMRAYFAECWQPAPAHRFAWPLPNVWLGVSVEDQARADERIQQLLATPAAVRFISAEPLLAPLDIRPWLRGWWHCSTCGTWVAAKDLPPEDPINGHACPQCREYELATIANGLDLVIVGGESGPAARPMHPAWARSLRDQCQAAGVPFFFKQWGAWCPVALDDLASETQESEELSGHLAGFSDQPMRRVGKKAAGRLLDGRTWSQFPP